LLQVKHDLETSSKQNFKTMKELQSKIVTTSIIQCTTCIRSAEIRSDKPDAAHYFSLQGWKLIDNLCYCPKCSPGEKPLSN
ncbi:MAG: hypothetical protein KBF32_08930, partial [Chitinophagales bacterium]|nr:hypothetical protein [Chitinophagales bacterium]